MRRPGTRADDGFTLIELMITMFVLLVVSGLVVGSTMDLARLGQTMTNRADMHSGLRNATALLQQEVGQAGRVSLPGTPTLTQAIAVGAGVATVNVSSVAGMFIGEKLTIDTGANEETVTLTGVDTGNNQITATFSLAHIVGTRLDASGGFSAGIVPTTMVNGSTGTVLKIVGDINSDGNMVYVEYTCDLPNRRLYRNMMDYDAAVKAPLTIEQVLLDNLLVNPANPDGTIPPCFTYQERTFGGATYVIGVAIMTTVRTQARERMTNEFQVVTKALLNVAPRNVVNVWELASLGYTNRVQPIPPSVEQTLLQ
jgi:prepilin-type N-terminal cleavage/methylation domain-containing protein